MKLSKGFTLIELIVVMAVFLFIIGAALGVFISVIQNQKKVLSEQQLLSQISYIEEHMSKALRMAKMEPLDGSDPCLIDTHGAGTDNPGYIYLLTRYDGATGFFKGIKFINQSGDSFGNTICQEFFLAGAGTTADPYVLKELQNSNDDTKAVALTSPNLQINSIRFSINGSNGSAHIPNSASCDTNSKCGASNLDSIQPRVTILMNINAVGGSLSTGVVCNPPAKPCTSGNACDLSSHTCVPTRIIQTTVSQRNLNVKNN